MPDPAAYAEPLPSPPSPRPTKASSVKPPPLSARKLPEGPSVLPRATAKHYVVLHTVGNCAVVDSKPSASLKIIGDRGGYTSAESANKALRDSEACKAVVGTGAEAKFKAAQAKAKLDGVHTLTQEDIDGLSYEQIKQLRGY